MSDQKQRVALTGQQMQVRMQVEGLLHDLLPKLVEEATLRASEAVMSGLRDRGLLDPTVPAEDQDPRKSNVQVIELPTCRITVESLV